ncbi:HNH endonuclease [Sinorhizobium chiapasense]|uniref:HNH endonuclease signature motif containing protein n=1 Tax=Sinorhizobium chiapasense TaxID=501572 RepID=A0ABZ2BD43_9HYPH
MPFHEQPGLLFTRATVQEALQVPDDLRGGDWDTGYTQYQDEFFIFCNIGVAGRTGHDYDNYWDGETLVWRAKRGTNVSQPQIARLASERYPVHIFYRYEDRAPFVYAGQGRVTQVLDTQPVTIHWTFADRNANPELPAALGSAGFTLDPPGVHTQRATRGRLVIYAKRLTTSFPLVIGPDWEQLMTELISAGGLRPDDRFYYHNSTMRSFPQRLNGGTGEIPYGLDFGFDGATALSKFLSVLTAAQPSVLPVPSPGAVEVDPVTETEVTRAARLGQQKFRSGLLERYKGRCALTSIDMPEVLRASHIKPWSKSSGTERLDADNGLLLVVHLDSLFDRGLISFDDEGVILISALMSGGTRKAFGLDLSLRLTGLTEGNRAYLKHHRASVFVG